MEPVPASDAAPAFLSVPGCHPDFTLVVGSGPAAAEFRVHRVFLSRFSPFFAAAAGGSFKDGRSGRCTLPEDEAPVVLLMLRFMYRDPAFRMEDLGHAELRALLEVADKYGVADLPEEADRVLLGPASQLRGFPRKAAELLAVAAEHNLHRTLAVLKKKLRAARQGPFECASGLVSAVAPEVACEILKARMDDMKGAFGEFYSRARLCTSEAFGNKDNRVGMYLGDDDSDASSDGGGELDEGMRHVETSEVPLANANSISDDDIPSISDIDSDESNESDPQPWGDPRLRQRGTPEAAHAALHALWRREVGHIRHQERALSAAINGRHVVCLVSQWQ
ncbi:hypothetical protein DFJ74DRAFT_691303 [Hyaloraphidium curvatum]|nr:hypothetical protein DFJ74DRAFT_691303 [Hyaloraphidium curvatum]